MSESGRANRARVFFALWPDARVREALAALTRTAQAECGGRATGSARIHVTLAFIGAIERARVALLEAVANGIASPPFDLHVSTLGWWRHDRIVWAGGEHCPEALQALAAALQQRLAGEGFNLDERPYAPHVTLLRDARRAPAQKTIPPLLWPVREFVLAESVPAGGGVRYEVLARWPLVASL